MFNYLYEVFFIDKIIIYLYKKNIRIQIGLYIQSQLFTASSDIALVQLRVSITKEHICPLQLTQVWKIFSLDSGL